MHRRSVVVLATLVGLVACQDYDFVFQHDMLAESVHLRFAVETPSKADLLFVVDNSGSMGDEQTKLLEAFGRLAEELGRLDTRYRIGLVSTDAFGSEKDCEGELIEASASPGSKGNCDRTEVELKRPHDGARGRLLAAYDPQVFAFTEGASGRHEEATGAAAAFVQGAIADARYALEHPDEGEGIQLPAGWEEDILAKLDMLLPLELGRHPDAFAALQGFTGEGGARWVIDRETIRLEACQACGAVEGDGDQVACEPEHEAFATCAEPVAQILVRAYFRANMAGLGVSAKGYEQGLKSSLLAVGIGPDDEDDVAMTPAHQTTAPGGPNTPPGPNTYRTRESRDAKVSWLRDDALLGILYVSDEQDCSMTELMSEYTCRFEQGCPEDDTGTVEPPYEGWMPMPQGSACYQPEFWATGDYDKMLPRRLADLLKRKKQSASRIAVGFIGGAQPNGPEKRERGEAAAADCRIVEHSAPSYDCSCLASDRGFRTPDECNGWCMMTADVSGMCSEPDASMPPATACDALGGSRYVDFADQFGRRTFESICNQSDDGFEQAMSDFVKIITLACFDLGEDVVPLDRDPANITVRRASRKQVEQGEAPQLLPMQDKTSDQEGWWYDDGTNQICLTGLDRVVGDVYDIFIMHKNENDYSSPARE